MISVDGKFMWFMGVVEDRDDPMMMSRVRVRVFGLHTEKKSDIPTEDLPWATVILPTTSSGVNGLGKSRHGLLPGSWVVGFWRDSEDFQDPIVIGAIGSFPVTPPDSSKGFSDPDGKYPRSTHLSEPDVNRLARGRDALDKNGHIDAVTIQNNNRDFEVSTADPNEPSWNEPESPYNAVYPMNEVDESEAGHITQIDSTPEAERSYHKHPAGTFDEIHPDGSKVTKIVGDNYTIIAGVDRLHVMGDCRITVDGNLSTKVGGDWNVDVGGDCNIDVGKDLNIDVKKSTTHKSGINHERSAVKGIMDSAEAIHLNKDNDKAPSS